jgi:type IV secretion system protein VirB2
MVVMLGKKKFFSRLMVCFMAAVVVMVLAGAAFATGTTPGTGGLAWEAGLKALTDSITGPVAQAIGLIAIVAAGAALIFGGDMTGFMRTAVYIVLVLGIIMSAANLLTSFTGVSATLPFLS